jgi:hypothetical protein
MSKTVDCPKCGEPMDVPAYSGDGVYTKHTCKFEGWDVDGPDFTEEDIVEIWSSAAREADSEVDALRAYEQSQEEILWEGYLCGLLRNFLNRRVWTS